MKKINCICMFMMILCLTSNFSYAQSPDEHAQEGYKSMFQDPDKAITEFQASMNAKSADNMVLMSYMSVCEAKNKIDGCIKYLKSHLEKYPVNAPAHQMIGVLIARKGLNKNDKRYFNSEEYSEARKYILKAKELFEAQKIYGKEGAEGAQQLLNDLQDKEGAIYKSHRVFN